LGRREGAGAHDRLLGGKRRPSIGGSRQGNSREKGKQEKKTERVKEAQSGGKRQREFFLRKKAAVCLGFKKGKN